MKKLTAVLFICAALVSVACADVMMTACPLGEGKWSVMLGSMADQNYYNMGNTDVMYMDSAGYGLTDNLDLYASCGLGYSQKGSTMPMGIMTMSSIGAALKYTLISESLTAPISVAADCGVRTCSMSMASMTGTQYNIGLIASKMIKIFTPYVGINLRETKMRYQGDYSQVDYTVGTAIGPMERMFMIEDTLQLINGPMTSYQSNQIAAGACFGLN